MIQNEVFDHLFRQLSGRTNKRCDEVYNRKRYNRAVLALACQNYFFGTEFQNATGLAGVTFVDQTAPVEREIIVRGGGLNARVSTPVVAGPVDASIGEVNFQLYRTGTSRSQINKNRLRSSLYVSDGQGQPWSLDWATPWVLLPNEIIQTRFLQITATAANTIYAVNFYGVAADPKSNCNPDILQEICKQINDSDQRPLYLNLKTVNSGGAIHFPAIGANQVETVLAEEVPEFLLVLGFRRNANDYLPGNTTFKLSGTTGRAFSRNELVIKGFENYCAPDNGYFRLAVPHLIPKGQSLTAHLTTTTTTTRNQFEGEINLLCVTV